MANFNTHLSASITLSIVSSICLYNTSILSLDQSINLTLLGVLAGLLADIDSDTPYARHLFYGLLGFVLAIIILLNYTIDQYPILINVFTFIIIYALSRYGLTKVITRITQRRGVFHSIPMAVTFSLAAVLIYHHWLNQSIEFCWWAGIYVLANYLLHLILDEIYSVDLANDSYRKSYFNAFKLISLKPWWPYLITYILIGIMIYFLPRFDSLIDDTLNPSTFESVWNNLV